MNDLQDTKAKSGLAIYKGRTIFAAAIREIASSIKGIEERLDGKVETADALTDIPRGSIVVILVRGQDEVNAIKQMQKLHEGVRVMACIDPSASVSLVSELLRLEISGITSIRLEDGSGSVAYTLREVLDGNKHYESTLMAGMLLNKQNASDKNLSPAEDKVAELLSQGMSNKEIASALNVTIWTVKKRVGKILQKYNAKSRVDLALKLPRKQATGK